MRSTRLALAIACSVAAATTLTGCGETQQGTEVSEVGCGRACLLGLADAYLSGLASNTPPESIFAQDFVFVENLTRMRLGEGLWASATGGPTDFAIPVPDTDLQQVGWLGVIEREGAPVMLGLRLKVVDGLITEAEHLVTEPAQGDMTHLATPRAGLLQEIPANQRLPHAELMRIGASYYDALDDNVASKTPFADDCQRLENGMITAGEGVGLPPGADPDAPRAPGDCIGQIDSQLFTYIDRIENRRMVAADPVTGLSMGFSHFRHPMDNLPYRVTNADGSVGERNSENLTNAPFDMPAAHIFKIGPEGEIHEIEAVGVMSSYNSPTGWE